MVIREKRGEKIPLDLKNGILRGIFADFAGHETPMQTLEYIRRRNDFDITDYMLDDSALLGEYPEKDVETEKVKKVKVV